MDWIGEAANMFFGGDGTPLVRCAWPDCTAWGDPWKNDGWHLWRREYLWLPEGFFCPQHDAEISVGIANGRFKDWPLDMSPEVVAMCEEAHIDPGSDLVVYRRLERMVEARRASFHIVGDDADR